MLCFVLLGHCGRAAQWATGDGLVITLDDASGAVLKVSVDGRPLPLSAPGGGLSYREFSLTPEDQARTAVEWDFERQAPTGTSALMAEWDTATVCAHRRTDGPAAGEGYLRLSSQPANGVAALDIFALPGGSICRITWQGRSRSTGQLYILCLRLFDATGRDITASAHLHAGGPTVYLTVHNPAPEPLKAILAIRRQWWVAALGEQIQAHLRLPAGECALTSAGDLMHLPVKVGPKATMVVALTGKPGGP